MKCTRCSEPIERVTPAKSVHPDRDKRWNIVTIYGVCGSCAEDMARITDETVARLKEEGCKVYERQEGVKVQV